MKTQFIILDWACNHCWPEESFKSFDDAWEFLQLKFDDDEDLFEFQVVEESTYDSFARVVATTK